MKTTLAFILLVATLGSARAASFPEPKASLVKIESAPCASSPISYRGAGLLFRSSAGEAFVLTSEHVLIHSNDGICHKIRSPLIGEAKASLFAVDWGIGLALLKLDSSAVLDPSRLSTLDARASSTLDSVYSAGYPYEEGVQSLVMDGPGRIISASADRKLFPGIEARLLEVLDAHGEFGMSGGLLFSASDGGWVGVLSNQYLELAPGSPTPSASNSDPGAKPALNHILAIPADIAAQWVSSILAGADRFPAIREYHHQLANKPEAVVIGGVLFEMGASAFSQIGAGDGHGIGAGDGHGIGAGDGHGIGAGDGHGIGGAGDGHGIGGAPGPAAGGPVQLSLASGDKLGSRKAPPWASGHLTYTLEYMRAQLSVQPRIAIASYLETGNPLADPTITSLGRLLRWLNEAGHEPVLKFIAAGAAAPTPAIPTDRLKASIDEFLAQASGLPASDRPKALPGDWTDGRLLLKALEQVDMLSGVSASTPTAANQAFLKSAICGALAIEKGWRYWFNAAFDQTTNVRSRFAEVEDLLGGCPLR